VAKADLWAPTEAEPADSNELKPGDATSLYFHDLGRGALLKDYEEQALARQYEQGRQAAKALASLPHPSDPQEVATLKQQVQMGLAARDQLITANARLVISIAQKYRWQGVPLADLIQEGNLGLMKAVEGFDPGLGFKIKFGNSIAFLVIMKKSGAANQPRKIWQRQCSCRRTRFSRCCK
jgi:DNA-directed RNA polymerase sigma subunit (sigma70/sigma32)